MPVAVRLAAFDRAQPCPTTRDVETVVVAIRPTTFDGERVIETFDDGILDNYDTADALRGYIEVIDRRGERYAFPMVSISMGVASNVLRPINSQWEASAVAVEMKEFAKKRTGSSFEIDRRTG